MKRILSLLALLLATATCDAAPTRTDDGVAFKPRTSRPTCPTGKKCLWNKNDGSLQISDNTTDTTVGSGGSGGGGAAGTRITVALSQPFGAASITLGSASVFSIIYYVPTDVTVADVRVSNREFLTPGFSSSAVASMTIGLCQPSTDRQSCVGGTLTSATVSYPANGMWAVLPNAPVHRDASGYVMVRYTVTSGAQYAEFQTGAYQCGIAKIATGTDITVASGWTDTCQPALAVGLSYDTARPKVVVYSDSIWRGSAGVGEGGVLHTVARLGPERDYAVSCVGVPSSQASQWAGFTDWMLHDQSALRGATFVMALGRNDIRIVDADGTTVIQYIQQIIRDARAAGAQKVIAFTIPPSAELTTLENTNRAIVNAWILGGTGWIDSTIDVDRIVKDPGAPNQLYSAYAATGGIHFTTAAFDAVFADTPFPTLLSQVEQDPANDVRFAQYTAPRELRPALAARTTIRRRSRGRVRARVRASARKAA